jgi:Tfp pilus assembly protein PilX
MERLSVPGLRNERGIALPMALGFVVVLSIALVSVVAFTSSAQRSSKYSKSDQVALSVAEAGLGQAHSVLVNSFFHTHPGALPASCAASPTVTAEGGTACYWGTLSANVWTVHARATVPNPSGGSPLTHEVSQQMAIAPPVGTTANNPAWNYMYSDSPTGCMSITSSVQIRQKVYVKNDLCLDSSAQITSEAGEVSVGGEITTNSSAWIGQGTPIAVVNLGSASTGCNYGLYTGGGLGYMYPCSALLHHVNATTQNHTVPPVDKPAIDVAYWYTNAQPGPSHPCTSSTGTPPTFDNNSTMDNTSPAISLVGGAYSCSVAGGGSISWVPGSPGTLTVNGTIFFDGDIVMTGSTKAQVVGRGTIYTSGRILIDGSVQICSVFSGGDCDTTSGTWDPDVSMLTLVAGSGTTGLPGDTYGIELNSSVRWQGGVYAVGDYLQTSSVITQGPVIANQIYYDSSTGSTSVPFDDMTPGAPGNPTTASVTAVPDSWRG